jgi:hypothetical protein
MMNYPNPQDTINLLLEAARKAAEGAEVTHPEDIACAMLHAIECGWPVVLDAYEKFK